MITPDPMITPKRAYFGVDGRPVLSPDGFAAATYLYDPRGNEIEYAFFGVDGKPTLGKLGIARVRRVFDLRGNVTEMEVFGVDGPVNFFMGCCPKVVYAFDDSDREIKATFFDAKNREVPTEIVVLNVVPGSMAQGLGLAPGDRILRYDRLCENCNVQRQYFPLLVVEQKNSCSQWLKTGF